MHQDLYVMTRRVNHERSTAEAHEQRVLDEVQLEIAKMNMLVLKISAEGGAQQEEGDSTGTSAAVSRMREVAMQMLQFPVPSGCFAPCLIMKDTYVIMMVDVERR
jgi:hypothetical protein